MNAELIAVGSELLLGDIVDTNTAYLARALRDHGINLYFRTVVGDNRERLTTLLKQALTRSDLVILTGGLGPTYDDITTECTAEVMNRSLQLHEETERRYQAFFRKRGKPVGESNIRQAMLPEGAIVFPNPAGLAPGIAMCNEQGTVILLPGPPREMTATFESAVAPWLFAEYDHTIVCHSLHFYGIGEAELEDQIGDYMAEAKNPTIAPYVNEGEVKLMVRAAAESVDKADQLAEPIIRTLQERFPAVLYGVDVNNLETALGLALKASGETVATAESCTGGLIAKKMTDIPGSSEYFLGGICTYTNQVKESLLGVSANTLDRHGAVSEETAREMAENCRQMFRSTYALATTGIAGPDGGTDEKPVGLVYIALATPETVLVEKFIANPLFESDRLMIRETASKSALHLLLKHMKKSPQ